jgi:hypothetical protein
MGRPHQQTTAQRGYGWQHRKASEQARANLVPGTPCIRCGKPMWPDQKLHLDHDDYDRTITRGLSHASCNIAARNRLWLSRNRPSAQRQSDIW